MDVQRQLHITAALFQMCNSYILKMASTYKFESFVHKFRNLCFAGLKATLTLEADNGQAFVSLKAGLGCLSSPSPPPPSPAYPSQPRSPFYQRRQERRKATTVATK